jgi:SAM-dependent methyltransferase
LAHDGSATPSEWVCRWAPRIAAGASVLDLACGTGRHTRLLRDMGYRVHAVDRDAAAVAALRTLPGVEVDVADLEAGPWPYPDRQFGGVVATNYLHRPLLPTVIDSLAEQGVLIYETFAAGNERYGRPSNPAFLLQPGELLEVVRGRLRVIAYEDLYVESPRPAMVQRICAQKVIL